ncbi:MAG: 50S ribosomal protein L3 [Rhodospirillaceae bacterium]|nr:50S ribosomal protein L3 [Rhodospirillaceae bacterium]
MPIGLVGRKCGMTRVFTDAGESIPVTVIEALPNRIAQLKTLDRDGYRAVQVTFGRARPARTPKPLLGHFGKAEVDPGRGLCEFRLDATEGEGLAPGTELGVELFEGGQKVDVIGTSKGKGYAGTVKRHNFKTQDATHGNSLSHRAPGSIGQNQTPGRVFKGKKMSGQMGNVRRTAPNAEVVRIDTERNLILVRGGVPGACGGHVIVRPAVKAEVPPGRAPAEAAGASG